jgi:hypothetical protein
MRYMQPCALSVNATAMSVCRCPCEIPHPAFGGKLASVEEPLIGHKQLREEDCIVTLQAADLLRRKTPVTFFGVLLTTNVDMCTCITKMYALTNSTIHMQ